MRRLARPLPLGLAALVALAVAYTGYWFFAASELAASLDRWAAEARAAGYEVGAAQGHVTGFPFRFRIMQAEARIARRATPAWSWTGRRIGASARAWSPARLAVFVGEQRWTLETAGFTVAVRDASAVISLGRSIETITAELPGLRIRRHDWSEPLEVTRLALEWRAPALAPASGAPDAMSLSADAEGIVLPAAFAAPLGRAIARLSATLRLARPPIKGTLADAIARWRDDGGVLDVDGIRVRWGELDVTGEGTLALDSEMRPLGALSATVSGVDAAIAALREAGQLSPAQAAAVAIGLRLVAKEGTRGPGSIALPITLQDGRLYLDRFAVARLRPLFGAP